MTQKELNEVIRLHDMYLNSEEGGKLADMRHENMRYANMRGANMRGANMRGANMWGADMQGANMWGADMQGANMQDADMRYANMQGANIDYSAWPLWCGSLKAYVCDGIAIQLLYHTLSVVQYSPYVSEDIKRTLLTQDVVDVANRFHRIDECGKLKTWEGIKE